MHHVVLAIKSAVTNPEIRPGLAPRSLKVAEPFDDLELFWDLHESGTRECGIHIVPFLPRLAHSL